MSAVQRLLSSWGKQWRYRYDVIYQTINNGATEFGKRLLIASADSEDPLYFALQIPSDRKLIVFSRELFLSEGIYDVDLIEAPSGFTGGEVAFKSALAGGSQSIVQSDIVCGVTLNDPGEAATVMELPRVDTGQGMGNSRVGGAASKEATLKTFQEDPVILRVQKQDGADDFSAGIQMLAWEEDA